MIGMHSLCRRDSENYLIKSITYIQSYGSVAGRRHSDAIEYFKLLI